MAKKKSEKIITNREKLAGDTNFNNLCKLANVEPTLRQYSKFRMGKGVVYRTQVLKQQV